MTPTIVFLVTISSLIFLKMRDVSLRNNLNAESENRLLIASGLVSLFLVTKATLLYPQSIYWFLFFGVLLVVSVLCFDILKKEVLRFKKLKTKQMVTNVLFYSLYFIVIQLYN